VSVKRFVDVEPKVTGLLQETGFEVPTDLIGVALARQVHTLDLRNMLLDGALESIEDGFKVYIYDAKQEFVVPLTRSVLLDQRQRFTLAHEVGHTFFFDTQRARPAALPGIPKYQDLERLCNLIGSEILVPEVCLRRYFQRRDPRHRRPPLTIETVCGISEEFDVSVEVVIRRIARYPIWLHRIAPCSCSSRAGRTMLQLSRTVLVLPYAHCCRSETIGDWANGARHWLRYVLPTGCRIGPNSFRASLDDAAGSLTRRGDISWRLLRHGTSRTPGLSLDTAASSSVFRRDAAKQGHWRT
jgi:hypothetical protein